MQRSSASWNAAGIANTLKNLGTSLSLRFKDPNGLILEFMAKVKRSWYTREPRGHPRTHTSSGGSCTARLVASQIISREFQGFARRCHVTL